MGCACVCGEMKANFGDDGHICVVQHTHTAPAGRECGGGVGPDPELFGDLRDLTRGGTRALVTAGCHLPPGLRWSEKR